MLSLSVCAVTGVILALVLKSTGSSMGTFVSVVLCVGTAMLVFNGLISVYTRINMFTAGINQEYIKLIVKVIGISYVTEISSNICKENGFAALKYCIKSGCVVIGTAHGSGIYDTDERLAGLFGENGFKRAVILEKCGEAGKCLDI